MLQVSSDLQTIVESRIKRTDGCWYYDGRHNKHGYPIYGKPGRRVSRLMYGWYTGPIPPTLVIDHLCHTQDVSCTAGDSCPHRRCVNPSHLETVTQHENWLRGRSLSAVNVPKTECWRGHSLGGSNLYFSAKGERHCKECRNIRAREFRARRGEERRRAGFVRVAHRDDLGRFRSWSYGPDGQ